MKQLRLYYTVNIKDIYSKLTRAVRNFTYDTPLIFYRNSDINKGLAIGNKRELIPGFYYQTDPVYTDIIPNTKGWRRIDDHTWKTVLTPQDPYNHCTGKIPVIAIRQNSIYFLGIVFLPSFYYLYPLNEFIKATNNYPELKGNIEINRQMISIDTIGYITNFGYLRLSKSDVMNLPVYLKAPIDYSKLREISHLLVSESKRLEDDLISNSVKVISG